MPTTIVRPARITKPRSFQVFDFSELPETVQEEIIDNYPHDYAWYGEMIREDIENDTDHYYPEFLPDWMSFRSPRLDTQIETDAWGNATVRIAVNVDTCQLLDTYALYFPNLLGKGDDIEISVSLPKRYESNRIDIDYFGEEEVGADLLRLERIVEEKTEEIEHEIASAVSRTWEWYGSEEYVRDQLENNDTQYLIDGTVYSY